MVWGVIKMEAMRQLDAELNVRLLKAAVAAADVWNQLDKKGLLDKPCGKCGQYRRSELKFVMHRRLQGEGEK